MSRAMNGEIVSSKRSLSMILAFVSFFGVPFAGAETGAPAVVRSPTPYQELAQSLENTTRMERESLAEVEKQLLSAKDLEKNLDMELSTLKIQASTHGTLLQLPKTQSRELETALETTHRSMDVLSERARELDQKQSAVEQLQGKAAEQVASNERQIQELEAEGSQNPQTTRLLARLSLLTGLLSRKQAILGEIHDIYAKQIDQRDELKKTLSVLSDSLDQELKDKKKQDLFLRSERPLAGLSVSQIREDAKRLFERVQPVFTRSFWSGKMQYLWNSSGILLFTVSALFLILQMLLFGLRRFCILLTRKPGAEAHRWACLTLRLFQRSLPLLGTLLFVYLYAMARRVYAGSSFLHVTVDLLTVWLLTQWGFHFLKLFPQEEESPPAGWSPFRLRVLLHGIRLFAVVYVLLRAMLENTGALLILTREVFELALLAWSFSFWRRTDRVLSERRPEGHPAGRSLSLRSILKGMTYTVALGGILLELGGYGELALYWFTSWGRTLAVVLWITLFFLSLREWEQVFKQGDEIKPDVPTGTRRPLLWLLMRLCWLVWVGALFLSLFISWGAGQIFLGNVLSALNRSFALGGLQLHPISFVYAFLILLFTHTAVRLWRYVLQRKILASSGMEIGLQESIVTISVYLFWAFGILISLSAVGVSTTSITVGFGALGIGIGFGLQNIFNNFISGIILLFERPIQPGDAVEIDGVWGIVKKINVRSTVVQTWDNASLIIPNSEFISRQVTNWSFKDLTLRRNIVVGVAYGSDTELVRKTLLEVASSNAHVRKRPEPDVLFFDFGDSALIFKLRVWTTVQMMLVVETQIRFEIDRLFRERDITIAFPQRDVHLHTLQEHTLKIPNGKPEGATEE